MYRVSYQVQRNVRNPWAKGDCTLWNVLHYSDSFRQMEKVVKNLNLNLHEEQEIIGKMKQLEMNGNV